MIMQKQSLPKIPYEHLQTALMFLLSFFFLLMTILSYRSYYLFPDYLFHRPYPRGALINGVSGISLFICFFAIGFSRFPRIIPITRRIMSFLLIHPLYALIYFCIARGENLPAIISVFTATATVCFFLFIKPGSAVTIRVSRSEYILFGKPFLLYKVAFFIITTTILGATGLLFDAKDILMGISSLLVAFILQISLISFFNRKVYQKY
jgi:hypothetical protein